MTPILRNRHEKVQEASINLIGRIGTYCLCFDSQFTNINAADRGAEHVPAREWMRICFELLDLLKAHKKAIRRAAVNSFGYIAKTLGPQDVLSVLLTNLRVQERQSRVCSTVAIAIVAETCGRMFFLLYLLFHAHPCFSSLYLYSCNLDRVSYSRTQRAHWMFEGPNICL